MSNPNEPYHNEGFGPAFLTIILFGLVLPGMIILSIDDARLKHNVDTKTGNSGSAIILEETEEIIGIHSHGGCSTSEGAEGNGGTAISKNQALAQAIKECLQWEDNNL